MQEKIDAKEFFRQIVHIVFGTIFVALTVFFGIGFTLQMLILFFIFGAIISFLIMKKKKIPFFSEIVGIAGRGNEKELPGQGALLFFLGAIITMALFSRTEIVIGALIVLVYGDGFATVVGKSFGKTKLLNSKTLEGTLAGIISSAILLSLFFPLNVSIITAVIGMLAEFLPIDDNLTIPIISGFTISFLL